MKEITATKKIILCGTSWTINITKEAQALGLQRGEFVEVTLKVPQDHD